jgi:lipoic acid synthetase
MSAPDWLKVKIRESSEFSETLRIVKENSVRTVCEDAACPNLRKCWKNKTATFLIMGEICTRNCRFCNITSGTPNLLDVSEPQRVAQSILDLGLQYAVITSVTRDDLPDGGAQHFADVINSIHDLKRGVKIEILTPDFQGNRNDSVDIILASKPTVFSHNLEIVKRLHHVVKGKPSSYEVSIDFLKRLSGRIVTKTGIMVGVGESKQEVLECIDDVANIGIDIMTIGQYLSPSAKHHRVDRYVLPQEFDEYKNYGEGIGIKLVCSGPLVRSSYDACESFQFICNNFTN